MVVYLVVANSHEHYKNLGCIFRLGLHDGETKFKAKIITE